MEEKKEAMGLEKKSKRAECGQETHDSERERERDSEREEDGEGGWWSRSSERQERGAAA